MPQTIPIFVINLTRRPDRLARVSAHLAERGVSFTRQEACDARTATEPVIASVIRQSGPLGRLGQGDRACTVSHIWAWQHFLDGDASHALFLEDDVYLAEDLAELLADTDWIPPETDLVKLEKFDAGSSRLLLAAQIGHTPAGRALHPMRSRHVGGGAYILSRKGAKAALAWRGRIRVPVDHFLFNDTVSPLRRVLRPVIIRPAMATQWAYGHESDNVDLGRAVQPTGWRKRLRSLCRGVTEINQAPRQLLQYLTGRAKMMTLRFEPTPPGPPGHTGSDPGGAGQEDHRSGRE
ncbi:glycosyltransferase family 25 protein [Rhodophyticola sp. CCM32]|uniref:glycosyltransferase family 25 protein n=1 Tax=Rhodophyticola sp. CCM32 TaxID=2916397 RepID=UPI00107FC249|nr:glycosyltransferase family 25 protein [Rhodophyticola sp. CCM32]QBY00049.1 glycosyltransferase family 25 protein [Rhodophyticola sp. CCM32]